jgi:hypothetical protein
VIQLRILADIVAFDLTHVYLMLDVLDQHGGMGDDAVVQPASFSQKHSILKLTLPQCHVFLRALREFHGLIEVTTPVLEEARRLKNQQNGTHASNGGGEPDENVATEASLDDIIERLNTRAAERPPAPPPPEV